MTKEYGEDLYTSGLRALTLRSIDVVWTDHLKNLERARESVTLRSYGQREPLAEYKKEATKLFQNFTQRVESIVSEKHSVIAEFVKNKNKQ